MQISSLTDIVEGKLVNTPAISFITQVHTELSKVNEGDAFFAINTEDIPEAIKKGAFAIIYQNTTEILDEEIAWIQVELFEKSITNVLRYKLLEYNNGYIFSNSLFLYFLKIFKSKELNNVLILDNDLNKNFELLSNLSENKLVFSTDSKFLHNISSEVLTLENRKFELQNLTIHSLFETSFSYKEKFFDRLKIPRVYVDYLLQVLELFEYKLDLKKLSSFNLFKPVFINKSNQIASFGHTNRFIIANTDYEIYKKEIEYLQTNYSYADIIIKNGSNLTDNEIMEIIKKEKFNALYFQNLTIEHIIEILKNNDTQEKLL